MDEAKGEQATWRVEQGELWPRATNGKDWFGLPNDVAAQGLANYLNALEATVSSLRAAQLVLWECPDCGFSFDAIHTEIKDGVDTGEHYCPACAELRLEAEVSSLREERDEARRERDFAHDKGYQEGYTGGYLDGRQNLDDVKGQLAAKTEEAAQNAAKAALADERAQDMQRQVAAYLTGHSKVLAKDAARIVFMQKDFDWLTRYDALLTPSTEQSQP